MSEIKITVRFYEELNDHLPEHLQKRPINISIPENLKAADVVEQFKIPMEEVHLVLVNGESVSLEHGLKDRDYVSVYPIFEKFDISSVSKVK